jgi:hypothetical protein
VLHYPTLHEQLSDRRWDDAWVRDRIATSAAAAEAAYDEHELWPAHEWDSYNAALPLKHLYVGAAGVVWALDELRRRGLSSGSLDLPAAARNALDRFRAEPDYFTGAELPEERRSSLFGGELGPALVAFRLSRDQELATDMHELVLANLGNPVNDLMWGVAGSLLAARAMHGWTEDERWLDAVRRCEDALRAARDPDGLWTQQLFGRTVRIIGAAHGLVGNVAALGEAATAGDVLRQTALRDDGHVNWPTTPAGDTIRLQWCHGAPGILVHAAQSLDDDLLHGAAELVWTAGPFGEEKGAGICHGTAGNGYALLRTFERTQDELWLERARSFAVHALEPIVETL